MLRGDPEAERATGTGLRWDMAELPGERMTNATNAKATTDSERGDMWFFPLPIGRIGVRRIVSGQKHYVNHGTGADPLQYWRRRFTREVAAEFTNHVRSGSKADISGHVNIRFALSPIADIRRDGRNVC
jgi:hypothetical protein